MGKGFNIKSLFFTVEEESAPEPKEQPKEEVAEAPSKEEVVEASVAVADADCGKKDAAVAETLSEALQNANLDGYDYFEFAKTLDALKPTMPAEQQLYQTAFASGSVMGADKAKLIETANHYLAVLDKENDKFGGVIAEQTEQAVTAKQQEVEKIDQSIQQKSEEIQRLTSEINELSDNRATINNEITENQIKIGQVQNNFAATLKVFVDKIRGDIGKIEKYIN